MPRYIVKLTNDEIQERKALIQKGGKGYRIKHAQILLKLVRSLKTKHGSKAPLHRYYRHIPPSTDQAAYFISIISRFHD